MPCLNERWQDVISELAHTCMACVGVRFSYLCAVSAIDSFGLMVELLATKYKNHTETSIN